MPRLLEVAGLGKRFGGFVALEGIDLTVDTGERLGLIGPNGSGKSTLVNCLCGALHHDSGTVTFDGRAIDGLPAYQRTRLGLARCDTPDRRLDPGHPSRHLGLALARL